MTLSLRIFVKLLLLSLIPCLLTAGEITAPIERPDTTDYFSPGFLRNQDHIYQPNIRTVLLHRSGWELTDPIIQINSDEQLELSFDDLEADVKNYHYTVVHCNADWHTSEIQPNEYIVGFIDDVINDYHFSFNTRQQFTHYELLFPNDKFKINLSGNYLLKVYIGDDPENLAFTSRFMIVDQQVTVNAKVTRASVIEDQDYRQDVGFSITTNHYFIAEPFHDITVVVRQNGRWDNALTNLKPYLVKGDELDYHFTDGSNSFEGGNEFRYFSIKSLRTISERLHDISTTDSGYQVSLWPDTRRTFKVYITEKDIDGRFIIKSEDEVDSQLEADYTYVNFSLPYSSPLAEGSIYVSGQLTDWQFGDDSRMKYNFSAKRYEAALFLKQGYYDYMYLYLPNRSKVGETGLIEGNHSETENSYSICVYHRAKGDLYDQLIAVTSVSNR